MKQAKTETDNLRHEMAQLKIQKSSEVRSMQNQIDELQDILRMYGRREQNMKTTNRSPSPPSRNHRSLVSSPSRMTERESSSASSKDHGSIHKASTKLFYDKYHESLTDIMYYSHLVSVIDDEAPHLLKGLTLTYDGQSVNLETALLVANRHPHQVPIIAIDAPASLSQLGPKGGFDF